MKYERIKEPIYIIGVDIRTTNDDLACYKDIPPLWQKVMSEKLLDKIPNKISDEVYGVYTEFEHEGIDNSGEYTFLIGAPVSTLEDIPEGFVGVIIPPSEYQVFPVEPANPEMVGKTWHKIWEHPFEKIKTYVLEFERYRPDGKIDICIGVTDENGSSGCC